VGSLKLDGNAVATIGWKHDGANNANISGLYVTGAASHGLQIVGVSGNGSYYNQWFNLVSTLNGGDGVNIDGDETASSRANVNQFFGGQIEGNTGDGFDITDANGTSVFGVSVSTNGGYAYKFTSATKQALSAFGGWIENNTTGGVNIDSTTKGVQFYGTRMNQSSEIAGAGAGNAGNVFMFDSATGVLMRWMQLIGANLQSPYIVTPKQYTHRIVSKTVNYNVAALDSGQTFTNNGAGGVITGTLPALAPGLEYTFVRNSSSNAHRIAPQSGEMIRNAGAAGGVGRYLSLDTNGGSVTLRAVALAAWEVVAINGGTISFQP
jgi:hypothetical protein